VPHEEPEIRCTDSNIPIDNNCRNDELLFGITGVTGDFDHEIHESDAIPTASRRRLAATELKRLDLGTSDVDGDDGEDDDDADVDEKEEASHPEDASTQNVEE
jgi:hypothetical protein